MESTAAEYWSGAERNVSTPVPKLAEPEVLLPSQFLDLSKGHSPFEGEKRLMLAVLEEAISTFQKYAGAAKGRRRRLFEEAEQWLLDEDSSWFFSFESICAMLDLDSAYLRQGLMNWKARFLATENCSETRVPRVRLRSARRHKILPFVPRRRRKIAKVAAVA